MKKILAILLTLALLTAGSYGVFGLMAKKNFDSAMEQISTQIPGNVDITYKQGFLSSTVELGSKLPMADNGIDLDIVISTSHTIYHGPFVFHAMQNKQPAYIPVQAYTEGSLFYELIGDVDASLAQGLKEASNTSISAYIPLMGDTQIHFSGAPLSKEFDLDGDLVAVDWKGFNGVLLSQGSLRDFTYDVTAPGLIIGSNGPERFELGTIQSSGTGQSGSFDIGLGNHKANIKNLALTFSDDPGDNLNIENIDINVIVNEKNTLLSVSEIFTMDSLSVNNKTYGPANITFHARNLDAQTLSEMNQEYMDMQKTNAGDNNAMQAQLMEMASTHGLTLLSKSPEFEFENISLKTAEGTGELSLKIRFNGEGDVIMNPLFLLGRLEAEATLGADERFLAVLAKEIIKESLCTDDNDSTCDQQAARASSEQLQQLLINKQLILENDRFISSVTFKDGAATLNGTPMPLF